MMKSEGESYRKGVSLIELFRRFPDDVTAQAWFVSRRWPAGVHCPHCGSANVHSDIKHKTMPYRCREKECAKQFSAKTGTVMEGSKLGFQVWMIATHHLSTSLKSVSSMTLHRDLNINQRSAWFLAHRLRAALASRGDAFTGPVEINETCLGGKRNNMPKSKRKQFTDRGSVGKSAVVGAKDGTSNEIRAQVVRDTGSGTSQGFVRDHAEGGTMVYTGIVRNTYQPSKAELEADRRVDATFDEAVRALAEPVEIRRTIRPRDGR